MKDVSGLMHGISEAVPKETGDPAGSPLVASNFSNAPSDFSNLFPHPNQKSEAIDNELSGDPRVMRSNPRTSAQIVDAVTSGDPAGLEHMWFGSTRDGTPSITYIDDFGEVQVQRVTTAQWMAGKEARGLNRIRATERQNEQKELADKKSELRPTFENGLDTIDNEAYRALLVQLFDTDPQEAVQKLVNDQRQSQADAEKNEKERENQLNEQAWSISQSLQNENINERNQVFSKLQQAANQAINSTEDSEAAISKIRSQQREISLRDRAMSYAPVRSNAMASPAEGMSPRQFQDALSSWLALSDVERMIPHPSNPNYETAMGDLMASLNGVVRDIGWQKGLTPEDMPAIAQAANAYLGVHGEAVEIQSLTKENEKLQKQIEDMKAQQLDVTALQQEATTQRADIAQMQSDVSLSRSKDKNRDGVVSAEEEASFAQDVSTLESGRAAVKGAKEAKASRAKAESKTELNKELLRISKEIDTLHEKIVENTGFTEYEGRIKQWKEGISSLEEEAKMIRGASVSAEDRLMDDIIAAFSSIEKYKEAYEDKQHPRHQEALDIDKK